MRIITLMPILLIALLLISATSAYEEVFESSLSYSFEESFPSASNTLTTAPSTHALHIEELDGMTKWIYFSKNAYNTLGRPINVPTTSYLSSGVTAKAGTSVLGTGTAYFIKQYSIDGTYSKFVYVFDFTADPWDTTGLTGFTKITWEFDDPNFFTPRTTESLGGAGYSLADRHGIVFDFYFSGSSTGYRALLGDYETYGATEWANKLTITELPSANRIQIDKYDGAYSSLVQITDLQTDSVIFGSTQSTSDVDTAQVYTSDPSSFTVAVKSPLSVWYNRTYLRGTGIVSDEPGSGGSGDAGGFTLSLSSPETTNYAPVTATLTPAAEAPAYDEIAWIHRDEPRKLSRAAGTW